MLGLPPTTIMTFIKMGSRVVNLLKFAGKDGGPRQE
jgi:hypothetical protein